MIKTLRLFLVAVLAIFSLNASAGSIVFADLNLENGTQYSDPFDGGDFTVTFGGGGNNGKYYNTGTGIRIYGDGTMTIAAKEGTIKKIVITYDGTNKPADASVVSVGTYDVAGGYWTGDAAEVTFTRPSGNGHWRVKSIAVNDDAIIPEVPTEGQTAETAITVARALEIIDGLDTGKSTDFTYYVKGVVISEVEIYNSSATFTIGDDKGATKVLKAYNLKGIGNQNIASNLLKKDDEVVLYGSLQKYEDTKAEPAVIIPEITSGYVVSVNGGTEGHEIQEITVAKAIEICNALEAGATSADVYKVHGYVVGTPAIDKKDDQTFYGNAKFDIADEKNGTTTLYAHQIYGLENKKMDSEDYLKDGDEVVIQCNLKKHQFSGGETKIQMVNGFVFSLNGNTSGINNIKTDAAKSVIYNMAGQRVMKAQKGLYIMNGKKFMVK